MPVRYAQRGGLLVVLVALATLSSSAHQISPRPAVPVEPIRLLPAEDQFDAVLYLGRSETNTDSQLAPALCADAEYMKMRLNRMALVGLLPPEANRLKEYCAGLTTK